MSSATAESALRDKLKVALQATRRLFDDGLVDENEFKDLKAHELRKYKEQLAAVTSAPLPSSDDCTPRRADLRPAPGEMRTPCADRSARGHLLSDGWHSGMKRPREEDTPPLARSAPGPRGVSEKDLVYVDPEVFRRLTTPPIFRRRRAAGMRRIVLPIRSAELAALQDQPEVGGRKEPVN